MTSTIPEQPTVSMKMTLREQIIAASVIGNIGKASFSDWNLIEEFMKNVGLKDTDFTEYGIENKEGLFTWKEAEKAKEEREFNVSPASYELFRREIMKINEKPGLTSDQRALAKKLSIFS